MKITKRYLKQIIKEELEKTLKEAEDNLYYIYNSTLSKYIKNADN